MGARFAGRIGGLGMYAKFVFIINKIEIIMFFVGISDVL